jgi:hypothetical protein
MTLNKIIETVKHDIEYFRENHNNFQRGRFWQAQKILDLLYQLEPAQLQQPVVGGPVSDVRSEGEQLPAEGQAQNGRGGHLHYHVHAGYMQKCVLCNEIKELE